MSEWLYGSTKVSIRNSLDGIYLDSRKICCRALLWWVLLRKNCNPDKWGSGRVILFVGGPLDVFQVHDRKECVF